MPCYKPLRVATDDDGNLDWSKSYTSNTVDQPVLVPCRRCVGCQMATAREWSIRCFHEATLHSTHFKDSETGLVTELPNNVMVTLTYDEESLPKNGVLSPDHLKNFIRRLSRKRGHPARQFSCGEYGGVTSRPHYHTILFNESLDDRYQITTPDGQTLSLSHTLDQLWPYGRATVDDLNWPQTRYVAGYVAKKSRDEANLTGPLTEAIDQETGNYYIEALQPEYRSMSRNPGIAKHWIESNYQRVYLDDQVVINGQELPPPTFYDRWLRRHDHRLYSRIQHRRLDSRRDSQIDWTDNRLASAELINSQHLRQDNL